MENKYVVSYVDSVQITEDGYAKITPSLMVDDDTTIGQIKDWFTKKSNGNHMEMKIVQLDNLKSNDNE